MLSIVNGVLRAESPLADQVDALIEELNKEDVLRTEEIDLLRRSSAQLREHAIFALRKDRVIEYLKEDVSDAIERARLYAYFMHAYRNLKYGSAPYSAHLDAVVGWVRAYAASSPGLFTADELRNLVIVCYCHDVIEDTGETYSDCVQVIGLANTERVYQLTNEKGRDRAERANEKYYGEMTDRLAKTAKIADRTSNMERGTQPGGKGISMLSGYLKTNPHFRDSLYVPGEMDAVWELFDQKSAEFQTFYDRKALELKIASMRKAVPEQE
jgi:hypothetical protein